MPMFWICEVWRGSWIGRAGSGPEWMGSAGHGLARTGEDQGVDWRGAAWQGGAWLGEARLGYFFI
jgi:hypothetical protein